MDKLQAMRAFMRVVDANSFARAADVMNLPRASMTRLVQELEASLHVRLINRTTRSLSVTSEGTRYYEHCRRIIAEVDHVDAQFSIAQTTARGRLHVDMPGALGQMVVIPALHDFHSRFPEIELIIGIGDRHVDLVREGIDCVLRVGPLRESMLVARRVGALHLATAASPGYLERHGEPTTPECLADHTIVAYLSNRTGRMTRLQFELNGQIVKPESRSRLATNNGETHLQCGLLGHGIVQLPRILAQPHLERGELIEILPDYCPPPLPISMVYPERRLVPPQVAAFIGWVAALFEGNEALRG